MRHWILHMAVLVIMAFIGTAVYLNSFQNGYHYDDIHHIVGNQYLTSVRNIPLFFTDSRTFSSLPEARNHYRPLLLTSYALNYYFSKFKPAGLHIVNLSFHVGSSFLLFLIVQAMVGRGSHPHPAPPPSRGRENRFAAVAAGLVFLTTPFNSEVVNYISARSSVMCTFFYLLAFYFWVKYRTPPPFPPSRGGRVREGVFPLPTVYYIASLLAFLFAMLTKEIAITLPFMLFVYDVYLGKEKGRGKIMRFCAPYIPFVLVAGIAGFVLRKVVCGNILYGGLTVPRGGDAQFFTELRLILKYIYMTVIPIRLSVDHPVEVSSSLWEPKVLVSLAILIVIGSILFFLRRSKDQAYRSISFLGVWFFITLSPTVVIPLNAMFQENRGYLPAVGIAGIAGILLSQVVFAQKRHCEEAEGLTLCHCEEAEGLTLCHCEEAEGRRSNLKPGGGLLRTLRVLAMTAWKWVLAMTRVVGALAMARVAGALVLTALVITYSGATWNRNRVWKDDATLWRDVEKKYSISGGAQLELGRIRMAEDPEQEEKRLKEVLRKDPRDTSAMNNLGNLYTREGRYDLAEGLYLKAIDITPDDYKPHFNLAKVYKERGDREAAAREYIEVLKLAPDHTVAAEFLAGLYAEMGKKDVIEGVFQSASQKDPGNPAFHRGLGITYARQQKWDMAAEAFKKVLKITPDDVQTRIDLGDSYMKMGRLDLAEGEFQHALELEPGNRMANQGLGILYQKQGKHALALKHYEKSIEGRSPSPRVLNNMGTIYLATGRTGKAIDTFREALRIDPSYDMARVNLGRAYEARKTVDSRQ